MALPQGGMTLYEASSRGDQLAGKTSLRDYARGQEMELRLGGSRQVFARCAATNEGGMADGRKWTAMRAALTNANPHPVTVRLALAGPGTEIAFPGRKVVVKNGMQTVEVTIPANQERRFEWRMRDGSGG